MDEEHGIGTYPVGWLESIQRTITTKKLTFLLREWDYCVYQARRGDWHAVRQTFNGYLAEWHYPPDGAYQTRCGSGWTRKRALRSAGYHIMKANLSEQERRR